MVLDTFLFCCTVVVKYKVWSTRYVVMSYELWVRSYELWVRSYELWVMSKELWVMSKEVRVICLAFLFALKFPIDGDFVFRDSKRGVFWNSNRFSLALLGWLLELFSFFDYKILWCYTYLRQKKWLPIFQLIIILLWLFLFCFIALQTVLLRWVWCLHLLKRLLFPKRHSR